MSRAGALAAAALAPLVLSGPPVGTGPRAGGAGKAEAPDTAVSESGVHVAGAGEYLSRLEAFGLAGDALVAVDGQVLLARGYGLADRGDGGESGEGAPSAPRPWTAGTVSTVGSITKQFTAVAVMALADRGRLSVADSIGAFFGDVPPDRRGVTVHHLLTHTSGLDAVRAGDFDFLSRQEIVDRAMASELLWEPGTRYRYSNLGYSLLGAIVEVVTAQDYEGWLRQNLFRPAGMYETGYLLPDYEPERLATGYRGTERWGTVIGRLEPDRGPSWVLRANGGIHTTLYDMHRWVQALGVMVMHAGSGGAGGGAEAAREAGPAGKRRAGPGESGGAYVLSRASRERMFSPQADEGVGSWYGYGWVVDTTSRGTPVIWHDGGNGILHADLRLYPAEGVETFMMTSTSDLPATALLRRMNRVLFGEEVAMPPAVDAVPVSPAGLESLTGTYRLDGGGALEVRSLGTALAVHAYGQEAVDALWRGEPEGDVAYEALNRRAVRFVRALGDGDHAVLRSLMGPDAPEEPYREARERMIGMLGPLESVDVLGTVPAWFHGGSTEATWLRLHFQRRSTVRRVHWSSDGTAVGFGGRAYPSPLTLRCAMTAPDGCTGWHEGLETGEPDVMFRAAAGGEPPSLTIRTAGGAELTGRREDP